MRSAHFHTFTGQNAELLRNAHPMEWGGRERVREMFHEMFGADDSDARSDLDS